MKRSNKKSDDHQSEIQALVSENKRLRAENQEIHSRFHRLCQIHFDHAGYMAWLEKENKRLLDCMNHGAIAMMDYQNSFQN